MKPLASYCVSLHRFFIAAFCVMCLSSFCFATPSEESMSSNNMLNLQSWTLDNGVKVAFIPVMTQEIFDIKFVFDAGSIHDGDSNCNVGCFGMCVFLCCVFHKMSR